MKLNSKGDNAEIMSGAEEMSVNLNVEIASSGIPVTIEKTKKTDCR